MGKHIICRVQDLPPGTCKSVRLEGRLIGIFHVKGRFYALKNTCPHQGANLCEGSIQGTMMPSKPGEYHYDKEGEIIRCPWHGWEFDITSGKSIFDPFACKMKTYDVDVIDRLDEDPECQLQTFPVDTGSGWIVVTE